jgi:hypothetical protein
MPGERYLPEYIVATVKLRKGLPHQFQNDKIGVEELDWPAQSHDLNPIAHLWDELECQLRTRPNRPTSLMLVAEWKQVPTAMFQHLVESLHRRVGAVIAAKGGPTPY